MRRQKEAVETFDLRAARQATGLSQIETAKLLHVTQTTISRWEIDGTMPRIYREYWLLVKPKNIPLNKKASQEKAA